MGPCSGVPASAYRIVQAVLGTAIDRFLEVTGEGVGVVEGLGGDADITAVAWRAADGDGVLLRKRQGKELPQLIEHPLLDVRIDAVAGHQEKAKPRKIVSICCAAAAAVGVSWSIPEAKAAHVDNGKGRRSHDAECTTGSGAGDASDSAAPGAIRCERPER